MVATSLNMVDLYLLGGYLYYPYTLMDTNLIIVAISRCVSIGSFEGILMFISKVYYFALLN